MAKVIDKLGEAVRKASEYNSAAQVALTCICPAFRAKTSAWLSPCRMHRIRRRRTD